MREQTPALSLRMRPSQRGPYYGEDADSALETLAVMTTQDTNYRCRDYLTRRSFSKPLNRRDDCSTAAPLDDLDSSVDLICREKMAEWSYRVCDHFHTSREIVAFSFSYLDRFVDSCSCDRTAFKLAAMTSMFMATKVFNSKQISIVNLAELSRGEFGVNHIAEMEKIIVETLKWRLNPPTAQAFIERLCRLIPLDDRTLVKTIYQRAVFFAELAIFDYTFVKEERYVLAVACILNAMEGMDDALRYQTLPAEFLTKLGTSLCVDLDVASLERIQGRLWLLYGYSAQLQHDDVIPLHIRNEQKPTNMVQASGAVHSPISVDRPF